MSHINTAVLISQNKDFISRFSEVLKKNEFKIFKFKHFQEGEKQLSSQKIDVCFIDNTDSSFPVKDFLIYLNKTNPQAVIINWGKGLRLLPPVSNLIFNMTPEQESIEFDLFFENLTEILKREKSRIELAAMLIHDIRSPMNSMIGYLELLLNETFGSLNEGQKNLIEKAMILGDQSLDILEDINEVYQSEQYIFRLVKEGFDFASVLDEALIHLWIRADKKNFKIKKDIPDHLPRVYGDMFQIQRVITNLIGNAIKYCPENSTIIIRAKRKSNQMIQVSIEDNGGGIPENQLKRVFDKYYRILEKEQFSKGYGMGLYICKIIIKAHNGRIWAQNNDFGGVSFNFTLPIAD